VSGRSLQQMIQDEADNLETKAAVFSTLEAGSREAYVTATLILGSAQRLEAWSKLALEGDG
jgi:hypothetical protein